MSTSDPRKSNLELLRILTILTIVIGHFISQSAICTNITGANAIAAGFLSSGVRISVNVFLLIGTWFMVDSRFRPERIVDLYLTVALYTVPITLVMLAAGRYGSTQNLIQGFLPFFGRPVWFATAYISLIALTPFLSKVLLLDDKRLGKLSFILMFLFGATATVPCFTSIDFIADFSWFCVIYIWIGWAKRTGFLERLPRGLPAIILGVGTTLALASARFVPALAWGIQYWLDNIKTLPNFLAALLVFNGFRTLELGTSRTINTLAKSVFAVYIIHQVPAFREFEWNTLLHAEAISSAAVPFFVGGIIVAATAVFAAATIVDIIRNRLIFPLIKRSATYRHLVTFIERFYSDFSET